MPGYASLFFFMHTYHDKAAVAVVVVAVGFDLACSLALI